jgi:hypothetical protein
MGCRVHGKTATERWEGTTWHNLVVHLSSSRTQSGRTTCYSPPFKQQLTSAQSLRAASSRRLQSPRLYFRCHDGQYARPLKKARLILELLRGAESRKQRSICNMNSESPDLEVSGERRVSEQHSGSR